MALTTLAKKRRKNKSIGVKLEKSHNLNDLTPSSLIHSTFIHYPTCLMEYNDILNNNADKLIVVNFSLPASGECRMISHVIENMAHSIEYKDSVIFIYIDVSKNTKICNNYELYTYPTFMLIKNKIEIEKIVGGDTELLEEIIHLRIQNY